eukprot:scaffold103291_cov37-Tisochrysis_lutea.AAC.1
MRPDHSTRQFGCLNLRRSGAFAPPSHRTHGVGLRPCVACRRNRVVPCPMQPKGRGIGAMRRRVEVGRGIGAAIVPLVHRPLANGVESLRSAT